MSGGTGSGSPPSTRTAADSRSEAVAAKRATDVVEDGEEVLHVGGHAVGTAQP